MKKYQHMNKQERNDEDNLNIPFEQHKLRGGFPLLEGRMREVYDTISSPKGLFAFDFYFFQK